MDTLTHYVGLDYHQNSLQVCMMDQQARIQCNRRIDNDLVSLLPLLHRAGGVSKIAIEACEGAAQLGEALAEAGSWTVELAHPLYVNKLKGSTDKTDASDAKLLADLSRVGYLPKVWLPCASIRALRQLVNHRQRLVNDRKAIKLRVGAILRQQGVKVAGTRWSKAWLDALVNETRLDESSHWLIDELLAELAFVSQRIETVCKRLKEQTTDDAVVKKLLEIEGIGPVTAWALRASIGRFDRFKRAKQLSRYCGLSPRNTASGERQTTGSLVGGVDKALRALLIEAAHRLVRTVGRWREMCDQLMRRGKRKNVAVAAVANRWMRTVHHRMTVVCD
ncbi:MAG: IS110 family transposase [Phycisphaeraceae bacterium JB051]